MSTLSFDFSPNFEPLAARMRPQTFEHYIGQEHILAKNQPLRIALESGRAHSMILWGPPGTGKTTLAELIAHYVDAHVERISAVTSGVKEIRNAIEQAQQIAQSQSRRTLLFVDEVHRFNKSQQDAFLPYIEDGTVIFVGATTENPSFQLNNALLSRARVYLLKQLSPENIMSLLNQALNDEERGLADSGVVLEDGVASALANIVQGDARMALNYLELLNDMAPAHSAANGEVIKSINLDMLTQVCGDKVNQFDNKGDLYYDLISALHKSVRGSSPDGALYWYCRLLAVGGDPLYVGRRLLAIASEDIGNADPKAMQVALSAWDCYHRVGPSEGERAIAQAVIYLACAPKSNAVYSAFNQMKALVKQEQDYAVPEHLRNAPTKLMADLGYGAQYRYAHNEANAFAAGECYLPQELKDLSLYQPTNRGLEAKISEKLDYLKQLNQHSDMKRYE
ncbi:replication-associated recombination protein A [Psychrobium sp. 1_MG-2023]|uniref:replication-associated recombination protein A n=1 Tax=Psychrobium sp. 1_MG-2023 TaxID=3062624 RepID=UPI000C34083F|nr:replication-associated recombination protein A [Psychrobium sp. 1_MG-2023]MDP2561865.1 replication-associated recombination protein A [Psychrobium sp. 1_MG-2023]PKF59719.1 recombination factor protein RarA [Alteromonadales bacterium alter-6D02]